MTRDRTRAAIYLGALAVAAGAWTCSLAPDAAAHPTSAFLVPAVGIELFVGILAFAGAVLSPEGAMRRLGLGPGRLPLRLGALLVLGTLGISSALDGLLELTGLRARSALVEIDDAVAGASGASLVVAFLALGVLPGVAEELLCRGFVQRGLARRTSAGLAIAGASVFFGLLHVEPIHALFAALLGAWLGTAAWLAGSIRVSIACHVVNNSVAVGAIAWLPAGPAPLAVARVAVGAALAGACLLRVLRRAGPPAGPGAVPPTDRGSVGRPVG